MPKKKGKKRHHKEISKSTTSSSSSNNDTLKSTNESIEEDNKNHPRPKMDNNDGDDVGIDSRYPPNEQPISNRKATISQFSSWNQAFQAAASITPHDLGKDYVDPSSTTKSGDDDNVPFGSGNVGGISQIANEYLMTKSENSSCLQEKGDNMESRDDYKREDSFVIKGKDEVETSSIFPTKKKKKKKDSKKKKKKTKTKSEDNDENGDTNINDEEKDTVVNEIENNHDSDNQNLEGKMITHQDQSVMVLVDYQHEKVYSALNRSKDGNLIEVGIVGKNCEIEITNEDGLISSNSPSKDEIEDLEFPFDVDPDDHCESPFQAYQDICPMLEELLRMEGGKTKDDFAIYDPFYCNGSVIQHLNELGFSNVYNKKEDCYETWSKDSVATSLSSATSKKQLYPEYKAFITNPPYSGDHIERLISHLTTDERTKGKPWFLLMPTFVHKKDYYKDKVATKNKDLKNSSSSSEERKIHPFYLVPKKRYVYIPPKQFREKKLSDVHKKSSPFVSMWYVYGGTREKTDRLFKAYKEWQKQNSSFNCELARGKSALRDLRRKKI